MYVCMYVCMYICMYVCMYVCRPLCMWVRACRNVYIYIYLYIYIYIYIYIFIYGNTVYIAISSNIKYCSNDSRDVTAYVIARANRKWHSVLPVFIAPRSVNVLMRNVCYSTLLTNNYIDRSRT